MLCRALTNGKNGSVVDLKMTSVLQSSIYSLPLQCDFVTLPIKKWNLPLRTLNLGGCYYLLQEKEVEMTVCQFEPVINRPCMLPPLGILQRLSPG